MKQNKEVFAQSVNLTLKFEMNYVGYFVGMELLILGNNVMMAIC